MYNHYEPLPAYSLYDHYKDIYDGRRNDFTYDNEAFTAIRTGFIWQITRVKTGHIAVCGFYLACGTDLHGVAAYLIYENKSLNFDSKGNLVVPIQ